MIVKCLLSFAKECATYLDLLIYVCWIFSSEITTNYPLNNYDPLHSL